jgi:hypothetical protein
MGSRTISTAFEQRARLRPQGPHSGGRGSPC